MKNFFPITLIFLLFCASSPGQAVTIEPVNGRDARFVQMMQADDKTTAKLAEIARERAASPCLKALAVQIAGEQAQSGVKLKEIALARSFAVVDKLDKDHQMEIDRVAQINENRFDQTCLDLFIVFDRRMIALLEAERSTSDPDLKSWVDGNLPQIKNDLDMALDIKSKVKF